MRKINQNSENLNKRQN